MLSFKKLLRDLWLTRSRALVMVVAIAVGLLAFDSLVGAYSILTREVARNYLDSAPAAIILELDGVSQRTLNYVRAQPDVAHATRRAQVRGRFSTPTDPNKRRAFLFVVDDFREMDVAKIFPQAGVYPPAPGTAALERSAQAVVGGGLGTTLLVDLPGKATQAIKLTSIVHEPALAPANTEQAAYLYMSQQDLAGLGIDVEFDELRLIPTGSSTDRSFLEHKARDLAARIEASGHGQVHAIRVPPPAQHPHQPQMTTVLSLFIIFAGLIVILASLLTGSLMATMMARQVREMGILKTLGARSSQILLSYVLLVELLAVSAWALSYYPSQLGTQAFVDSITRLLNFDVVDRSQTVGARAAQVLVAACVPLLVTLPSLIRGSRHSVMRSLSDYGVGHGTFGASALEKWAARLESHGELFTYALRGAIRRRGRFLLSLALLATAGAIFLSAVGTARSWEVVTQRLYESRHYDFEIAFSQTPPATVEQELAKNNALGRVETWHTTRTAPGVGKRIPIERTYPDGAHGAFALMAPPPHSNLVSFEPQAGRLFDEDKLDEVVLNQVVPEAERYAVGDEIVLSIGGQDRSLTVVGKLEEVGAGAVAYVSQKTFFSLVKPAHRSAVMRVAKADGVTTQAAMLAANRVLEERRAAVAHMSPLEVFENAVAAHFEILIRSLLALAGLTAIVGALGLASALSTNVAEATRELAVLRALGATGKHVRRLVVQEALLVSGLSYVLACLFGLGLSAIIGHVIGNMSFQLPLPLSLDWRAAAALVVGLLGIGALSSLLPAQRASGLTVASALRAL